MSISLSNPYLEKDAIRAPNFFNGRLLSAEDLSAERAAMRRMLAQLGRATGDGIAYGLEVTGAIGGNTVTDPVVTVSAGLAINREGDTIELSQAVDVSLRQPSSAGTASTAQPAGNNGAFGPCGALSTSAYAAGKGVYLLTIAPTEGREGRAPVSGLGSLNACCGDKSIVEGVEFRLIRIDELAALLNDSSHLQNAVAYQCFAAPDDNFAADPFGAPQPGYGLIDGLRAALLLGDAEVPLATIHWTDVGGTRFVDNWSVRRRVARPASSGQLSRVMSDRRLSEGEAMLRQFEAHLRVLAADPAARSKPATATFGFLPAAGLVPISGVDGSTGFDYPSFFAGLTIRGPFTLEGARVEFLLGLATALRPIDLSNRELIWLYRVRENIKFGGGSPGQPYLLFASGQLPYVAESRYDVAHWGGANYEL
jgi:hypothetical protein